MHDAVNMFLVSFLEVIIHCGHNKYVDVYAAFQIALENIKASVIYCKYFTQSKSFYKKINS